MEQYNVRVCYITNLPNLNGSNRSMIDMIDGFGHNSIETLVLINGNGPIVAELEKRNIKYRIVRYSPSTNSDNFVKNMGKIVLNSSVFNAVAVNRVKKCLIEEKVDLIHVNNFLTSVGMEAAYRLKLPYICHLRDYIWEDHQRRFVNEERQYYYLNKADRIIAISKGIQNKYNLLTNKEIIVINDGIRTENYILPHRTVLKDDTINLLIAGRIVPGKGQLDAMKAICRLKTEGFINLKLYIVGSIGDNEYYKELKRYKDCNNLECVYIYPFISDLKNLREQCDIGLTCSKLEGLGRVTIENMLSSMLVICSDTGGSKDIVKHGKTGLLYREGSVDSLVETIKDALNCPGKSNEMVTRGYEEAQTRFDYINYANKIKDIYKQIVGTI